MKRIKIAPGFRLELVASEPMIREPVALTWDGNGRVFVAEMLGYMQDIHGTGAKGPVGRFSRLEGYRRGWQDGHALCVSRLAGRAACGPGH